MCLDLSVCLSVSPFFTWISGPSIHHLVHVSVPNIPIPTPIYPFLHPLFLSLSLSLCVCLSTNCSVYPSLYTSVCPSFYPFLCPSFCLYLLCMSIWQSLHKTIQLLLHQCHQYKKYAILKWAGEFALTICLAWEGLSLDFAAMAANSTSFFNASIFELKDFIVCNLKIKICSD